MSKSILTTPAVAVYDDVLTPEAFAAVWAFIQRDQYSTPFASGSWNKVWRLGDSSPLGSTEYESFRRPFGNGLDVVAGAVDALAPAHADLIGRQGADWSRFTMRTYLYPRGSKLSWHTDAGTYTGAFIFYAHPRWSSTWGGELMIADVPDESPEPPAAGSHLDHTWQDERLLARGTGIYILPKPNRLGFLKAGTLHALARVDADAGDNVRCTVSGFFVKPGIPSGPRTLPGRPIMSLPGVHS